MEKKDKGFIQAQKDRKLAEQIEETLLGVEYATNFEEQERRRKGISLEEYQKRHGRMEVIKGIKPSSKKEIKNNSNAEKETDLESWVRSSIPVELQDIWGVGIIFREISKAKPFQDVWNFKVYTPKGFTEKALIRYSSQKIEELEYLSGTNVSLRSKEISFSRNISDEIFQIMREIKFHKSTNECPSKKMYNNSEHSFSVNASFYLRRKIMIEKLEEMLALLAQYKVQRE